MILRNTFINAQLILNHMGDSSMNVLNADQEETATKNRRVNWNAVVSYKSPRKEDGPITPRKPSQHREKHKKKSILKSKIGAETLLRLEQEEKNQEPKIESKLDSKQ